MGLTSVHLPAGLAHFFRLCPRTKIDCIVVKIDSFVNSFIHFLSICRVLGPGPCPEVTDKKAQLQPWGKSPGSWRAGLGWADSSQMVIM